MENDLELAILKELELFILELGNGFTFVERQIEMHKDGIMVAEYWTNLPPKKCVKQKYHGLEI